MAEARLISLRCYQDVETTSLKVSDTLVTQTRLHLPAELDLPGYSAYRRLTARWIDGKLGRAAMRVYLARSSAAKSRAT
jgi:hypothetical protein